MTTETLRPNASGDLTQLTPTGAANNWDCVNDTTPDGDTTRVGQQSDPVNELIDLYGMEDTTIPDSAVIDSLELHYVSRSGSAVYRSIQRGKIKTGGIVYSGSQVNPPITYTEYTAIWTTNPQTSLAWTKTQLNALQIGVGITCGDDEAIFYSGRCTQVFLVVNYHLAATTEEIDTDGFHFSQ